MAVPDNIFKKFGGLKDYKSYLTSELRGDPESVGAQQRTRAYETVGRQTQGALEQNRVANNRAFGSNQVSSMDAARRSSIALNAGYGGARIAGDEATRRHRLSMGRALMELGMAKGNYYAIIKGVALQKQAMENAEAMAAAGGGGGLFG